MTSAMHVACCTSAQGHALCQLHAGTSGTLPASLRGVTQAMTSAMHVACCTSAQHHASCQLHAGSSDALPALLGGPAQAMSAIACGARHTCAVGQSGQLFCWGWSLHGQCGQGRAVVSVPQPQAVSGVFTYSHACIFSIEVNLLSKSLRLCKGLRCCHKSHVHQKSQIRSHIDVASQIYMYMSQIRCTSEVRSTCRRQL